MPLAEAVCQQARALIARHLGLAFPEGRRRNLETGFLHACHSAQESSPERYLAWLMTLPATSQEWQRLAGYLTVGETYFFRDQAVLEALEQQVLPGLMAARRARGTRQLRLWSAGCATGEEAYSLAMLLDRLLPEPRCWQVTILATDINRAALERAQRGLYRSWSLRATPAWVQASYFQRHTPETLELLPRIRQMVTFLPGNLANTHELACLTTANSMDIIFCRNVLMYFTPAAQRRAVAHLQQTLAPDGWLVVAAAEASAELFKPLQSVLFPGAIFYRKEPVAATAKEPVATTAPLLPLQVETSASGAADAFSSAAEPVAPPEGARPLALTQPAGPTQDPLTPEALLQHTRTLADQGCLEAAQRLCMAALAQAPLNPEAHLLSATIQHEHGSPLKALEALRRAIYLAPDCAPAHFLLGSLLLQQGEPQRGRRAIETVVHLLHAVPRDEVVPWSDGLTAGRLLKMAQACLEAG